MLLNISLKLDIAAGSVAHALGTQLLMAELSPTPEHIQFRAVGCGVEENGTVVAFGRGATVVGGFDLTGVTWDMTVSRCWPIRWTTSVPVKQPALIIGCAMQLMALDSALADNSKRVPKSCSCHTMEEGPLKLQLEHWEWRLNPSLLHASRMDDSLLATEPKPEQPTGRAPKRGQQRYTS
jgi:hypothetical protein